MSGKTWAIIGLCSALIGAVPKIRKPVVAATKATARAVSQPVRHPKKDAKAVGGHVYHFFKGDR